MKIMNNNMKQMTATSPSRKGTISSPFDQNDWLSADNALTFSAHCFMPSGVGSKSHQAIPHSMIECRSAERPS
jgi:hypothetical protein